MASRFELDVLAEIASLNMATMKALSGLAAIAAMTAGNKREYLSKILEAGLRDLEKTNYWSVPADQKAAFLENAKARYTDLVTGIREA